MTLSDEQIQDLLRVGNPTDEECRLIRMGWDAAMRTQGIPDGYKLMPIEPTTIMMQYAGSVEVGDSDIGRFVLSWDEIESIYAAMIYAAPEAKR